MTPREAQVRAGFGRARRIVVKVGSSLITDPVAGVSRANIRRWCGQLSALLDTGRQVLLVSSGAVAEGMARLGWTVRPESLPELQAAAAVGQMGLVEAYESAFAHYSKRTAVVLLTHDDLANRRRYLNARATLQQLLDLGVVPVINENDSVATDEIRFGDNDTLGALVTNLLTAELLIVLTDVDGLHDGNPRLGGSTRRIGFREAGDPSLDALGGVGGALGRGGMQTKIRAARLAARSGAHTVLAHGAEEDVLQRIIAAEDVGTVLASSELPLDARKRWIADQLKARGDLVLDAGAVRALRGARSLLPVGVVAVLGEFSRGEMVRCVDEAGALIAQGLVNYSSTDARKLLGANSDEITVRLGYRIEPELVHRDNLVVIT
jgi:glutamate 5-kinase